MRGLFFFTYIYCVINIPNLDFNEKNTTISISYVGCYVLLPRQMATNDVR